MKNNVYAILYLLVAILYLTGAVSAADTITLAGQPAELLITPASDHTLRITFKAVGGEGDVVPVTDGRVLVSDDWGDPILQLREIRDEHFISHQNMRITVHPSPLSVEIKTAEGELIQHLVFDEESGSVDFEIGDGPVFGLGNGGQYFDRRGTYYTMRRGHRRGEYTVFGARTPIPFLIGTEGWSMFFHRPYNGHFDLREAPGRFIPRKEVENKKEAPLPLDIFVTNVDKPARAVSEYVKITGKPAMPPKWALGYMQSHRNLSEAGPEGIMEVARTFREKELPVDALIYLGRYTDVGWNKAPEEEFEFHPESFPRPQVMLDEMHDMNYKVSLHLTRVPDDLHGHIPPQEGETVDEDHVASYWDKHKEIFSMGFDGWWPDMGDGLNNDERLARHYMYRKGPLQERPNERPWSLHRTGFAGMQRFGGWNWSGDINSSWATLKAHVPVGINASLSTSPFWGTDIGGFYPTEEFTGELYTRWFQFGAFTPSFRTHGVVWRTRLPWGWNPGEMGPVQIKKYLETGSLAADTSAIQYRELDLHTTRVEPIIKKYLELRYRLMPYLYTIVRETHDTGLPPMRALWLHYPDDPKAVAQSHEYLWGRNMLIAPIVEKGTSGPHDFALREIYLPEGKWYNFWRPREPIPGKQTIRQTFDLESMPIYIKAGTILPLDPVRQYVDEPVDKPMTLRIYPGSDGEFELYNDDGRTLDFQEGEYSRTLLSWDDQARTLTIEPSEGESEKQQFRIEIAGEGDEHPKTVQYRGEELKVQF